MKTMKTVLFVTFATLGVLVGACSADAGPGDPGPDQEPVVEQQRPVAPQLGGDVKPDFVHPCPGGTIRHCTSCGDGCLDCTCEPLPKYY
jgi:hypothetical protein